VLYLILFSIVQKQSVKKREERTLKKVLRKLKKESVGNKGER
jgi:hypothetical protein